MSEFRTKNSSFLNKEYKWINNGKEVDKEKEKDRKDNECTI